MPVNAIYKLTLAARIFETALRFPAGSSQNASLPEARIVDLSVDGSMIFPHPRRASPVLGKAFFNFGGLSEKSTGNAQSPEGDQRA